MWTENFLFVLIRSKDEFYFVGQDEPSLPGIITGCPWILSLLDGWSLWRGGWSLLVTLPHPVREGLPVLSLSLIFPGIQFLEDEASSLSIISSGKPITAMCKFMNP